MRHRCCVFVGLIVLFGVGTFLTGCGSSSSGNAKVRLVNANPDQSSLDLLSDDTPNDNTDNRRVVVSGISYGAGSAYTSIGAGSHIMYVQPSGSSNAIINTTMNFSSGSNVTMISANYSYSPPTSIVLDDDNSAPASGDFKLRIVNCSPGMGAQDVYIVTSGTDINSSNPVFTSLGFASASSYVTLSAGSYDVVFTPPGSKFVNLSSSNTWGAGQIRTVLSLNDPLGSYKAAVLSDVN